MKKKLMIIGMIAFLIIASCITVYAGAHSVTLVTGKTEVKAGETFTVQLKVATPDGINGMVTSYSYDTEKLELVSKRLLDSNFTELGSTSANEIVLMFTPANLSNFTKVTETNIYEFTFKVKEGATVGSTATITVGETQLSTLATSNADHKIPGDEIAITVAQAVTPDPDPEPDTPGGENPDPEDPDTPDYPYAGLEDYALILVLGAIIVAVVLYKKTNKMRDIK